MNREKKINQPQRSQRRREYAADGYLRFFNLVEST